VNRKISDSLTDIIAPGTGTVQRVVMEQSRPFDVDVAEAACAYRTGYGVTSRS
jgi:hypothetical protein